MAGVQYAFWKTMLFLVSASRLGVETSGWLYASDSSVRRSSLAHSGGRVSVRSG